MKNILSESYRGPQLPRKIQLQRIRQVIAHELTDAQREIITAYYFQEMTIPEIAESRGLNKSTVCRTLKRAERRLQKYLTY